MKTKYFILIVLLSIVFQPAHSADVDTLKTEDDVPVEKFSFFLGAKYGSNYVYYGRSFSENKPFYSTDLNIMHKSGFWTSGSVYHIYNEKPYINFYDLSLGWQDNFNSWLDGGISFSRFVFPRLNFDGSSVGFSYWNFQTGLDWIFLYSSISASFVTGDNIDFFLVVKNSRYFQTKKFSKEKMYFSFDPSLTLVAGTSDFYKVTLVKRGFGRWPGIISVVEDRSFQILDMEMSFPFALNWGKFSFEPAISYYHPVNLTYNDISKQGFYFNFSLYLNI